MKPILISVTELQLGDTVAMWKDVDEPWTNGIVNQIRDGIVHIFRPYGCCADFSYAGGVIPYIGIENITIELTSSRKIKVVDRKTLR